MAGKTVYSLNDIHAQVINPSDFKICVVDCAKNNIDKINYANAGFFTYLGNGESIPVGHLVVDGNIITTNNKPQSSWINTYKHDLTTIVVYKNNAVEMIKTNDISSIPNIKYAISGIPIIRKGYKVSLDDIKSEGYFGNELYNTWHGFLGVRDDKLVYVAGKLNFNLMVYLLEVMGITDGIKLDGGGSFVLRSDSFKIKTDENRRINNIITWEC